MIKGRRGREVEGREREWVREEKHGKKGEK